MNWPLIYSKWPVFIVFIVISNRYLDLIHLYSQYMIPSYLIVSTLPWILDHYKDRVAFGTPTLCHIILLVVFSHFDGYRIQILAGNLTKYLHNFYLKNWKACVFFILPSWLFLRLSKWFREARALFMHVIVSWVHVT